MAKTCKSVFEDENEKTVEKIMKALEKSGSSELYNAFRSEVTGASVKEFPKYRIAVTDNFVCSYNFGIKYDINIFKLSDAVNAYRSLMNGEKFDYTFINLILEMNNGVQRRLAFIYRGNLKKTLNSFDEVITEIKSRPGFGGMN